MIERLTHGCTIRTHHLPLPHVIRPFYLIPIRWQLQLYERVEIPDIVRLCPTHAAHAHLARDAAVGQMVFGEESVYDRRQFGRETWGWAEDAAYWLLTRRDQLPAGFGWRTGTAYRP